MKIWLIKRTGKTWLGNMPFAFSTELYTKEKFYADLHFYRKKEAVAYLKHNYRNYPEYWEVIGVELPKSKEDNRKRS